MAVASELRASGALAGSAQRGEVCCVHIVSSQMKQCISKHKVCIMFKSLSVS